MVTFQSFATLSGLFLFFAFVALLNRWLTLGGLLLTVAGAAGVGVFWERWSRLTGYDVEVRAIWHPVPPTFAQAWLLGTHAAMLLGGVALLAWIAWRRDRSGI